MHSSPLETTEFPIPSFIEVFRLSLWEFPRLVGRYCNSYSPSRAGELTKQNMTKSHERWDGKLCTGVPCARRLGQVDLDLECSTVCPILLMGIWQKRLGKMVESPKSKSTQPRSTSTQDTLYSTQIAGGLAYLVSVIKQCNGGLFPIPILLAYVYIAHGVPWIRSEARVDWWDAKPICLLNTRPFAVPVPNVLPTPLAAVYRLKKQVHIIYTITLKPIYCKNSEIMKV